MAVYGGCCSSSIDGDGVCVALAANEYTVGGVTNFVHSSV